MARNRWRKRKQAEQNDKSQDASSPPLQDKKKQKRQEDRDEGDLPRKKFYRQRAHANPFSDHALTYPLNPESMDWSKHYPAFVAKELETDGKATESNEAVTTMCKKVEVADIGCGFGGLLFALAPKMPDTLILGMEIRASVTEFVDNKIHALRRQHSSHPEQPKLSTTTEMEPTGPDAQLKQQASEVSPAGPYSNISVLRANTMKFLPNFFFRGQLKAIFLCFPDPHFKQRKHKARIVSPTLNSEYAYVMRPRGIVYTITDVQDLHEWMSTHFEGHPLFEGVDASDMTDEERIGWDVMHIETEEGKKVDRYSGTKYAAAWRRMEDPEWPAEEEEEEEDEDGG